MTADVSVLSQWAGILSFVVALPSAAWAVRELITCAAASPPPPGAAAAPRFARKPRLVAFGATALTGAAAFFLFGVGSPVDATVKPPISAAQVAPAPSPAEQPREVAPPHEAAAAPPREPTAAPPREAASWTLPPAPKTAGVSWTVAMSPKLAADPRILGPRLEPAGDPAMKARATSLIRDFVARSGEPADQAVRSLAAFYAPQVVSYGGKPVSRYALLQEKERTLFDRWPSRRYTIRPATLDVTCDAAASTCSVAGVLDWDYGARFGSSKFSYVVSVQGDQAMIVKEDGSTLELHDR